MTATSPQNHPKVTPKSPHIDPTLIPKPRAPSHNVPSWRAPWRTVPSKRVTSKKLLGNYRRRPFNLYGKLESSVWCKFGVTLPLGCSSFGVYFVLGAFCDWKCFANWFVFGRNQVPGPRSWDTSRRGDVFCRIINETGCMGEVKLTLSWRNIDIVLILI